MLSKKVVIVSVVIPIALLHFVTGSHYRGPYPGFVNGYLLDILVPFAFYFLLCLNEFYPLRLWVVKSLLVFGVGASVRLHNSLVFQYSAEPLILWILPCME